ncbi:hypothetical protein [Loktanella sp. R86503]|uniref:hypothetical protein n=1 Tax=Loktanella sp. R86503 TaxID=3093847 RepID=UPI0036D95925
MTNGSNDFGVTLPQISFLLQILDSHKSVESVERKKDIQFDIATSLGDKLRVVCINEYTCGLAKVLEVLETFPGTNIIYVGGAWNGYTMEAKEYCIESGIGLFNSTEISGALFREDYWRYHKRDKEGNPLYSTRSS